MAFALMCVDEIDIGDIVIALSLMSISLNICTLVEASHNCIATLRTRVIATTYTLLLLAHG